MTDKQIIVDVTQCPYYREGKFCVYLSYKTKCEGNCIWTSYKEMEEQLKTKEQECEELTSNCSQLKQTLTEIKEIAQYDVYTSRTDLCLKLNWVKKKISECEVEDELHSPLL